MALIYVLYIRIYKDPRIITVKNKAKYFCTSCDCIFRTDVKFCGGFFTMVVLYFMGVFVFISSLILLYVPCSDDKEI